MDMIAAWRPSGAYYEQSDGDKLLYFKNVDKKINYDLVQAYRDRRQK